MPYGYTRPPGYWKARTSHLKHNPTCALRYDGCTTTATEVDAIKPESQGGSHDDPTNLQSVCSPCHAIKSEAERRAGIARRQPQQRTRPHPFGNLDNHAEPDAHLFKTWGSTPTPGGQRKPQR